MSGFNTSTQTDLIRANLWSKEIKEILLDELMGTRWVRMITDFPDGTTLNIPSIGQMEAQDYVEGQAVKYTAMDTGNFTFTVNKYKSSATFIYEKFKQDSYYMNEVISSFVPKQARALAEQLEKDMLATIPNGQTASDTNTVNNAYHRYVGGGVNQVITIEDFAKARFALQKANVPLQDMIAIVDPSVEYTLATQPNLINFSFNPQWEGIVTSGLSKGMKFIRNIEGFDVYVSMRLPTISGTETINSVTAPSGAVQNLFFSATRDITPVIGLIRQSPKVDYEWNKDLQRDEYVTTMRYGFGFYRPENAVVVLTDTTRVYS